MDITHSAKRPSGSMPLSPLPFTGSVFASFILYNFNISIPEVKCIKIQVEKYLFINNN